jgi:cytochrome P450
LQAREEAIQAIADKRDNIEGASLFALLPKKRNRRLLRLLVAYQILWDYLDSVSERGACAGQANGRQLHRALVEALDPDAPVSDYYRHHPWRGDSGYLVSLAIACRRICAELPCYRDVRTTMLGSVERCAIQSINHEPDAYLRTVALKRWSEREFGDEHALTWFELTAAAGAFMPHVLLALAAEPTCECQAVRAVHSAYFPWVSLVISMLDSYVDRVADAMSDGHSYLSYYDSDEIAMERLGAMIARIVRNASSLPNGARHAFLVEGIVAMYLSTGEVNTPASRETTRMLAQASGSLTKTLLPLARVWRVTRARFATRTADVDRSLPGPPLPTLSLTYVYWRWPYAYMERCQARYGKVFVHKMTSFPRLVFLSDRLDVKAMLSAPPDALCPGEGGVKIAPIVGEESFMLLDGDDHMSGRRAVQPVLRRGMIELEREWVNGRVRQMLNVLPRDVPVQLHPRLRGLTLEVVLRRIFGWQVSPERLAVLRERVLAMLNVTGSVVFPVPVLRHGPGRTVWARFLDDRTEVDRMIQGLIDERLERAEPQHREDALAALLAAHNHDGTPLSRSQLRDNVMSLILAGHETTASQLAWTFQLLAHHPRVQRRLIEEIDDEAGEEEYLTATIQEVLRYRPVFLFAIPRAVKRPIEIGGRTYAPPAHLLACIYLLHHDPEVYPDPDEFRPERFLEGQPPPYMWLPWGGGRKRCPGSQLAMAEMKAVLRHTLASVTVAPASRRIERPRWRSVIVTPHAGSRVVLRQRQRVSARPRVRLACPVQKTQTLVK